MCLHLKSEPNIKRFNCFVPDWNAAVVRKAHRISMPYLRTRRKQWLSRRSPGICRGRTSPLGYSVGLHGATIGRTLPESCYLVFGHFSDMLTAAGLGISSFGSGLRDRIYHYVGSKLRRCSMSFIGKGLGVQPNDPICAHTHTIDIHICTSLVL